MGDGPTASTTLLSFKIPVWWRRAVLPSLPWVVCFLSLLFFFCPFRCLLTPAAVWVSVCSRRSWSRGRDGVGQPDGPALAALCLSRPREKAARRAQVKNWLSFGGQGPAEQASSSSCSSIGHTAIAADVSQRDYGEGGRHCFGSVHLDPVPCLLWTPPINTPVREGEGSRTTRNRPYPVLKCSINQGSLSVCVISVFCLCVSEHHSHSHSHSHSHHSRNNNNN